MYSYPFEYDLPIDIPISIESKWGHVRYRLEAGLNRLRKFKKVYQETFSVVKVMDLNKFPELQVYS